MSGLFITGTDTGVGKTYVACLIIKQLRAAGLRVAPYKPVCSGAERDAQGRPVWGDVEQLAAASGCLVPPDRLCPQTFDAPLAPPVAAANEGKSVDERLLRDGFDWLQKRFDLVIVEGAGGLLSPLGASSTSADLAKDLGLPVIIVSADRLGMINHTLLTVEAAVTRAIEVSGVILSRTTADRDGSEAANLSQLQRFCDVPILGQVEFGGTDLLRPSGRAARIDFRSLAVTDRSR